MSTVFDFGTHCFRTLCRVGSRIVARQMRPVYQCVPDTADWRNVLEKLNVVYSVGPDKLVVTGNDVGKVSNLIAEPVGCMMPDGMVAEGDAACRQLIASAVESLLPAAVGNDVCAVILPVGVACHGNSDQSFLTQLVRLRGYSVSTINAGHAIVLAAGERSGFSGLGVSIGASGTSVSLVRQGVELANCLVPVGGDWIDEQLALAESRRVWDADGNCYLDCDSIQAWKHELTTSVCEPDADCDRSRLLKVNYEELLNRIFTLAGRQFAESVNPAMLVEGCPVYCAGGATCVPGFERLLTRNVLTDHGLDIMVTDVNVIEDDGYCVARGGLIHSEIEVEVFERREAA